MNTIARGITGMSMPNTKINSLTSQIPFWITSSLVVAIFVSALSVIYVAANNHLLFDQLQNLQSTNNAMKMEWDQLLVEQNTFATPARVEQFAEQNLNMGVPASSAIVMVNE